MEVHHIYHFQLKHLADFFLTPWSPRPNSLPNQKNLSIHILRHTSGLKLFGLPKTPAVSGGIFSSSVDVFVVYVCFTYEKNLGGAFKYFPYLYKNPTWGSDPISPNIFSDGWFRFNHLEVFPLEKDGGTHARWAPGSYKWSYGAPIIPINGRK